VPNKRWLFEGGCGRNDDPRPEAIAGVGLAGHANTNEELVAAARAQIAEHQSKGKT